MTTLLGVHVIVVRSQAHVKPATTMLSWINNNALWINLQSLIMDLDPRDPV